MILVRKFLSLFKAITSKLPRVRFGTVDDHIPDSEYQHQGDSDARLREGEYSNGINNSDSEITNIKDWF